MRILGIAHVGIAVEDAAEPVDFFKDILRMGSHATEELPDQKVIADIFHTGKGHVELLTATAPDAPISRFLEKRGPGLHHLALEVDDIRAWLAHLKTKGVQLIDEEPRTGAEGSQIAFLHPRSTAGVLIELCQKPTP